MKSIELMVKEHENVTRIIKVARKLCYKIVKNEDVDYDNFYKVADFIQNYADKIHHNKEEGFLFNKMMDEMGKVAEKLVKHGMLVEHDLGRLYVSELLEALESYKNGNDEARVDIIGSTISYTNLLTRHIEKENNVVYKFAEKSLSEETKKEIEENCEKFEKENAKNKEKYLQILDELEKKLEA
ncbi:MAG: hemerythrin domain-containing protein [Clostridium sp.]|uniref:hemerythrin domain-containing protein n=1 Tax=Clostridium sp. DSM 8431 TaxID=1761781 RepID=UPI0008E564AD|nr:hemerythrin domain-containing protein [Clostridium sp. DSM 8431]MCR4943448.1 hemerythrin domain-containing protein [Clostridium sp.]SFU45584.1 Hemerythrin-like domain-containing protein [Clostridium sp. DSM 8431]